MILMYDLDDNYLCEFKNARECADYFGTSDDAIHNYIYFQKKGLRDKKRDIKRKRWVRLFKEDDLNDDGLDWDWDDCVLVEEDD